CPTLSVKREECSRSPTPHSAQPLMSIRQTIHLNPTHVNPSSQMLDRHLSRGSTTPSLRRLAAAPDWLNDVGLPKDRQGVNPTGLLVLVADDGCSVAVAVSVGGTARAGDACHDGCVLGLRVAGQAVRVLGAYGGEVVHDASLIARDLLAARLPLNFLRVCR